MEIDSKRIGFSDHAKRLGKCRYCGETWELDDPVSYDNTAECWICRPCGLAYLNGVALGDRTEYKKPMKKDKPQANVARQAQVQSVDLAPVLEAISKLQERLDTFDGLHMKLEQLGDQMSDQIEHLTELVATSAVLDITNRTLIRIEKAVVKPERAIDLSVELDDISRPSLIPVEGGLPGEFMPNFT